MTQPVSKDSMRIAILSCFYPYRGGISQFNTYLFKELSKKHTVKAFNFKRQYPNFLFPGKTQFVAKEDTALSVESEMLLDTANPFSYRAAAHAILKWKPDLLLTRYWMSYFAPSLGYVTGRVTRSLKGSCKAISIIDNLIPHEAHFFDKPLAKYFLRRNDAFITLSSSVERELRALSPNSKVVTIPHPLYSNFGEPMDKGEAREGLSKIFGLPPKRLKGQKVLLFFGLIRDYKGLDILLQALPLLDKSYTLVVAGEVYGNWSKYEELLRRPDIQPFKENILIRTQYIPDSEVVTYFSAADVSVLPYRSATQSGISSISWNFDVPLITTPVGGLIESVGEAATGLLTENISPNSLAEAIKKFFADDKKEEYICNIKRLKKELSWEAFCNKLEGFVKNI